MADLDQDIRGRGAPAVQASPELQAARRRLQARLAEWRGELREHVDGLDRLELDGNGDLGAPRVEERTTTVLPPAPEPARRTRRPTPPAPARRRPRRPTEVIEPRRAAVPAALPSRIAAAPVAAAGLAGAALACAAAAAYVWLAVSDGGYAPSTYAAAGLVVWWAAVLALLLRVWPSGRLPRPTAAAGLLLAGFSILAILSSSWASDGGRAFAEGARAVGYLGTFVLAAIVARAGGARQMLGGLAIGLGILAGLALLSRLQPGLVGNGAELQRLLPESAGRLSYPIGYWNGLGACMALALCLFSWLAADARSIIGRTAALAALPLPILAIYLTDSRGATVASAAGLVFLVLLVPKRWRTLSAIALGSAGGFVLIAITSKGTELVQGLDTSPAASAGDRVTIALVAIVAVLALIAYRGDDFLERLNPRRFGISPAIAAGGVVAVVLALNFAIQPGQQLKESRSVQETTSRVEPLDTASVPTGTGSGRIEYWGSALDAFKEKPVLGLGAGEFATWWTEHGSLSQPVTNAHSLFIESLAELGVVGAALIAGLFLVAGIAGLRRGLALRRAGVSGAEVGVAAASVAMLAAGAVSAATDWTWELSAAFAPVLVAAAVAATPAAVERARQRTPGGTVRLGIMLVLATASIAALGVLYLSELRLGQSRAAASDSKYGLAADRAVEAHDLLPFSAEPYTQLALVERARGHRTAAAYAIDRALQRSPDDWRLWFLASHIAYDQGDYVGERNDLAKARELAPRAPASLFIAPGPRAPAVPPGATNEQ